MNSLPRTELWIATRVLEDLGLRDDAAGRAALALRMGWHCVFFAAGKAGETVPGLDYRRYSAGEVSAAATELPAGIVMDGPFERLARKRGLLNVLQCWNEANFQNELAEEALAVRLDLDPYLALPLKTVVIADDIAYDRGPYFQPGELCRRLFSLHAPLVEAVHAAGADAFFHSDGRLSSVLSYIGQAGFDGLAGCQVDENWDILGEGADHLAVIGGIDAGVFSDQDTSSKVLLEWAERICILRRIRRLILCSSTGITSVAQLEALQKLYCWLDKAPT